jgi:hypothetical protein
MRLRILSSALEDLDRGRRFYDRQGAGLGAYFLDSLLVRSIRLSGTPESTGRFSVSID